MDMPTRTPNPSAVTVRRNPHREARATPFTTASKCQNKTSSDHRHIPSFPTGEILSIQLSNPEPKPPISENLKVYLRIKPLKSNIKATGVESRNQKVKTRSKHAWPEIPSKKNKTNGNKSPKKKIEEACITVNDSHSVTVTPPAPLQELKRRKSEVYEGFSYVFPGDSTQSDVYGKMVNPLVEDFLRGKSGMLAALGPSGSGKTHTVFGSPREPGMVPFALRRIFEENGTSHFSRLLYLSIFEIYSEGGKGERVSDLLGGGTADVSIKNINEILVNDVTEAESLIARAMLKRATATTNSNSQSSRSQCIINMRVVSDGSANESHAQSNDAVLTIVDLAGAEREKRTGNQGARLQESNFINNTSMSLLEHQKNPKKTMQKHFKNSLLTRYLRDYLEGKKRMALILTVKAGKEDYLDTSFLLKQASPYMKIKFDNIEVPCNKRQLKIFTSVEQNKRMKLNDRDISKIEEGSEIDKPGPSKFEASGMHKGDVKNDFTAKKNSSNNGTIERNHQIMRSSEELWNHKIVQSLDELIDLLNQQDEKLKVAKSEIQGLREKLSQEQSKNFQLKEELIQLKSLCKCSQNKLGEASSSKLESNSETSRKIDEDTGVHDEDTQDTTLLSEESEFGSANKVLDIQAKSVCLVKSPDAEIPLRMACPRSFLSSMARESSSSLEECIPSLALSNDVEQVKFSGDDMDRVTNRHIYQVSDSSSKSGSVNELLNSLDELKIKPNIKATMLTDILASELGSSTSSETSAFNICLTTELPQQSGTEVKVSHGSSNSGNGNKPSSNSDALSIKQDVKASMCSDLSESALHSSMSSETSSFNICSTSELPQQSSVEVEEQIISSEGAALTLPLRDEVRNIKSEALSIHHPPSADKPKRRLMPASSVLLVRDMNALDIEDENEKPKASRRGRKAHAEGILRSQGSMALLQLLKKC